MAAPRSSTDPQTTVRVSRALLDQVAEIAKTHHRSLVGEVTWALEEYVRAHQVAESSPVQS
jgi:hypothetical protein